MATVAIESALAMGASERGLALLDIEEDQWFDRKSPRVRPRDLAESVAAMANAEGGVIVIGLERPRVEGIDRHRAAINAWRQATMDFTHPVAPMNLRLLPCVNWRGEQDELLVIEVETSEQVHANRRDEVYLRVGDENRRLSHAQVQELNYDKGQAQFEATRTDAESAELDEELLTDYAEAVEHPEPLRLLQARGLVGNDGRLRVGAILLFGREPQMRYPEASIRVLRYRGTERGTGARQQLIADVRCEGAIPVVLRLAAEEVIRLLPTRRALGADGLFGPVGLIPRGAWQEGLVNAVVHRSYSLMGDHIRIEIFDDRVEIESPGRFPGLVDLTDPASVTRFARNPRIARVCAHLSFGQELGEGVRRMFEEMRLAGLADPSYRQTSGSVHLTLSSLAVDHELERRLPAGSRDLLRMIREVTRASTGDLVASTRVSRPVVLRRLRALEQEGLIERVGRSRHDPRAYWTIARG